jgi:hypoxanthine phosphoribosyltransferase
MINEKLNFPKKLQNEIRPQIRAIIKYIGSNKDIVNDIFWQVDTLDPVEKIIYINNLVLHSRNTDLVIGLPRGGTEYSFLFRFMYKLYYGKEIIVKNQTVSLRSCKYIHNIETQTDHIKSCFESYSSQFENKNILIIDDLVLSGKTWYFLKDIFREFNYNTLKFSAMEGTLCPETPKIANPSIYKNGSCGFVPLKRKRFRISESIIKKYNSGNSKIT